MTTTDKPITEDAFWKAWDAYSNAVGPGNATITVLDGVDDEE